MYPHYDTPTESVIAYTAALLDSAGSIAIEGSGPQVTISLSAGPDSEDLVRWLAQVWQMGKVRTEPQSAWQVTQARAAEHLLTVCQPAMRVKRRQATEAREWVQEHVSDPSGRHWTPGEDRWLLDHWHHSNARIAEALGRSENAIPHRRRHLRPDTSAAGPDARS
ncbi:hypothetical protein ACFY0A_38975 [Streptomyces sp. NPDC001698]|uniref:hypothetical protein n=1 Tax=Streptomyces sp. NPDC001698 TaxID=3364601 RepID=UPI003682F61B